ncbi:MAG: hypothetical protein ABIT04_02770 [Novosphingobium sp.]
MTRILLSVLGGLMLVAAGLFWWQGRAETEVGAPPSLASAGVDPAIAEALPSGDPRGQRGAAPPEATEMTREQRRFDRLDRDRDARITRTEMLSPRAEQFRALDVNHDNLLTFEEWAVRTTTRFSAADANRDGWLSRPEFATTKPKAKPKPVCRCEKPPRLAKPGRARTPVIQEPDESAEASDDVGEPGA